MGIIQICIDAKKRTTTIKGYFTVNQEEAIEEYADRLLAGSNLSKAEYKKAVYSHFLSFQSVSI